jgi:glycosyltransferase involved in cell wall biosynthesis
VRVVINQWSALGQKTGIGHYTSQLLRCLQAQASQEQIDAFPNTSLWHACRFSAAASELMQRLLFGNRRRFRRRSPLSVLGILPRIAYLQFKNLSLAARDRYFEFVFASNYYDLYHEPNYIPIATDLPTVVTLHDLSVLLYPDWHPPNRVTEFEQGIFRQLGSCLHFLTDSESVRRQVIKILGVAPERVTRVHLGVRAHMVPLSRRITVRQLRQFGIAPGYLLHVGTIEPRKNLLMLMQSYCSLAGELREACPLLLVGKWGWKAKEARSYYENEGRHRGIRHIDYVHDRWLPALYNGARALVYPSFYEGFGLPPVEMLACGGAVLASSAEALEETVGGQAHLTDPEDADGWRTAMARVIKDDAWRQQLRIGAVRVADKFTWEACAANTMDVYRSLCGVVPRNTAAIQHQDNEPVPAATYLGRRVA